MPNDISPITPERMLEEYLISQGHRVSVGRPLDVTAIQDSIEGVREELRPFFDLFVRLSQGNITDLLRVMQRVADFRTKIEARFVPSQSNRVLALAGISHQSGQALDIALRDEGSSFRYVDFSEDEYRILGPNGFVDRVVREFNPPVLDSVAVEFSVPTSQPEAF